MVHDRACPGVGFPGAVRCLAGSTCARRCAADSLRTGFVYKIKMALKEHG